MADTWDALLQYASALIASVTEGRLANLKRSNGDFLITEEGREIPADECSGGQKSIVGICLRLALSQVFYGKGLTLLLDEPAADLADDMAAALGGMLRGLQHQVVVVTHRAGEAAVADEVIEIGG
jgi:DNA repair exonuclease SbcCD ATPase subunit